MDSFSQILAFTLTFFLGYSGVHYALTSWGVRQPITLVIGVLAGVIFGVFATLAIAPLIGA